jgi:hypothetical protein
MAHKKITIFFIIAIISAVFISCEFSQNNHGYPKKVYFGKEGGTLAYIGERTFDRLLIQTPDVAKDEYVEVDKDTVEITLDWLTAKYIRHDNKLIIKADSSPTGKKRKLEIYGDYGLEYAYIQILQKD